eukprot:CAMPEP_0176100314 /NCGR_PEP_ID=MMETSP0120_2-20121206/50311_1 /TAXON_ID=160619 /ORGANISM="Kryptoperidinium foliaceum, Strain CCMP 1326" /LENGTH=183 /DNA_ID=CAMNT_0017434355 /DNA_START=169 /DNA_END=718 /DNA_ORIENTATION=+
MNVIAAAGAAARGDAQGLSDVGAATQTLRAPGACVDGTKWRPLQASSRAPASIGGGMFSRPRALRPAKRLVAGAGATAGVFVTHRRGLRGRLSWGALAGGAPRGAPEGAQDGEHGRREPARVVSSRLSPKARAASVARLIALRLGMAACQGQRAPARPQWIAKEPARERRRAERSTATPEGWR